MNYTTLVKLWEHISMGRITWLLFSNVMKIALRQNQLLVLIVRWDYVSVPTFFFPPHNKSWDCCLASLLLCRKCEKWGTSQYTVSAVTVGLSKFCISILLVTVFCPLGKLPWWPPAVVGLVPFWLLVHFGFFGVNWSLSSCTCNSSSIFHHLSVFFQATGYPRSKAKRSQL